MRTRNTDRGVAKSSGGIYRYGEEVRDDPARRCDEDSDRQATPPLSRASAATRTATSRPRLLSPGRALYGHDCGNQDVDVNEGERRNAAGRSLSDESDEASLIGPIEPD